MPAELFGAAQANGIEFVVEASSVVTPINRETAMNSSESLFRNGRSVIDFIIVVALIAMLGVAVHHHVGDTVRSRDAAPANETTAEAGAQGPAAQAPATPATSTATEVTLKRQLGSLAGDAGQ